VTADVLAPPRRVTPTGLLLAPSGLDKSDRKAWLALRQTGIGGSDIGALLGMNRYMSPYQLWLDKRGDLSDRRMSERLERAALWGHLHEPLIAEQFRDRYGLKTRRIGLIRHETDAWRLANLDYQVSGCPDGPCLLEIKNRSAYKAGEWGPSDSDDGVPDNEALQTHWYLGVTGYRHAHVGVLLNGNDDRYYRIGYDPQLVADVVAMAAVLWQRVLDNNPPPLDGHRALTEFLAILWAGQEGARKEVDPRAARRLIDERARLRAANTEIATATDAVENQLIALLGEDEIAVGPDGIPIFTRKQNGVFAPKRFAEEYPALAAEYMTLVPSINAKALAADHPDEYRKHRARVLRISGGNT